MKKMFILGLLLIIPLAVRAEVSSSTQAIGAAADAKPQVEESLKLNESITTTTTTNSGNKDGDTTKDTGTTDNKETGVEDYFIALGTIGIAVTALLYVVDKKNVFKKI